MVLPVKKRCSHGAVHATAEQQEHLVVAHSVLDVFDAVFLATGNRISSGQTGNVVQKIL